MRRLAAMIAGLVTLLVFGAVQAGAATTTVTCPPGTGTTLQNAINAAFPGDTIRIAGECFGQFTVNQNLTLEGAGQDATLNGNAMGTVLTIGAAATVRSKHLTITNGSATDGGGINNAGAVRLYASRVTDNVASDNGGGIWSSGSVKVVKSKIVGNESGRNGGGVAPPSSQARR